MTESRSKICTNNRQLWSLKKVKVDERNAKGETARALAMMYGYTKIVSLIDSRTPRAKPGERSPTYPHEKPRSFKVSNCEFLSTC